MSIAKKVDMSPKLSRAFYETEKFEFIAVYGWLARNAPKIHNPKEAFDYDSFLAFHLMSADLHKDLNTIFEKQSCMIDGKYKKARLYLLETKNLYIAFDCETGDRGSHVTFKSKTPLIGNNGTYAIFDLSPEAIQELATTIRTVLWHVFNNDQTKAEGIEKEFLNDLQSEFGLFKHSKKPILKI